uniref:G_PROTEIN_RECEP_F2_4 domain-containing protein n=1 Tax=Angiostrongylus cantonensis TaxID=6313 RepID=A0A0K0DFS1_ANGCA
LQATSRINKDIEKCGHVWYFLSENCSFRDGMLTALTGFYCLFLTIFALVLELSHLLSGEEQREINTKDLIFGMYVYGVSILFFIYMYVVLLLNPRCEWLSSVVHTMKVTHCGPSAGSLFLRLGCVVFGVIGVVYYSFLVFLCSSDANCSSLSLSLDACAIMFIFTQMHFIFYWSSTKSKENDVHEERIGFVCPIHAQRNDYFRMLQLCLSRSGNQYGERLSSRAEDKEASGLGSFQDSEENKEHLT